VRPTERAVPVGDRTVQTREAGDEDGFPVVYFHGTPGSRLDLVFGDAVADDTVVVADALGLADFATLGMSGGGPFALATAAVGGDRVTGVGVASGAGPFRLVPGAVEALDEMDTAANALLPEDPGAAAEAFGLAFEGLRQVVLEGDDRAVLAAFAERLSARDRRVLEDPGYGPSVFASMREGLRPGVDGAAWDNVAWIGPWDVDLDRVRCPVHLWYGEEDRFAPMAHGEWLADRLADARLVRRSGEGHFGIADHLAEMLAVLAPAP